jgi:hypothetical protein
VRRIALVAAAALILTLTLSSGLASATPAWVAVPPPAGGSKPLPDAPPQRLPNQPRVSSTDSCEAMRVRLAQQAATGLAACVQAGSTDAAKAWLRGNPRAVIQPLPQWCIDNAFSGWWFTRTQACMVEALLLTVIDVRTGAPLGSMTYLEVNFAYTGSASINRWAQQIELRIISTTGTGVAGTLVQGTPSCTGPCVASGTFPPKPMRTDADAEAEGFFDTTITAAGAIGLSTSSWRYFFTNPGWVGPSEPPMTVTPPEIRCDNATPGRSIGCVFPDYTSVWVVSLTGGVPNLARHLRDAQASGLRGAYPNGTPLTRLTDATLVRNNGNTACPARFPRPTGYQCDEYPFRSTREGASTGGGTGRTFSWCQIPLLGSGTGPTGWSSCMIPAGENSSGGGFLGGFYGSNRVIDRDPFFVWIVA